MTVQQEIAELRTEVNKISDQWINEISNITNSLDYRNGSRFSYNIDRLKNFVKELNEFEIIEPTNDSDKQ